jgi:integrase
MVAHGLLALYCHCMSSLRRRPRSPFWYACITDANGKQIQFSTGLSDEGQAKAVAASAEAALRRSFQRPEQLRAALERLAGEYSPDSKQNPAAWLRAWAKGRKGEVADSTMAAYSSTVKDTAAWLESKGIASFQAVASSVLVELRAHWLKTIRPPTVNLKIKILRIAFGDAVKNGLMTSNPASSVPALKVEATARREFRPAELDVLLPSLSGEWLGLVMLGLYTGQRLNDLVELRWASVDLAGQSITFTAAKTGTLVALPLMPAAVDALAKLPHGGPSAAIFPTVAAIGKPNRSKAFRVILAQVGLADKIGKKSEGKGRETQELSFHSLRHTATSMLKAAGVSDAIARAIIGHESPAVSRSYTHFDMATMRREMARMPGAAPLRAVGES